MIRPFAARKSGGGLQGPDGAHDVAHIAALAESAPLCREVRVNAVAGVFCGECLAHAIGGAGVQIGEFRHVEGHGRSA